MSIFPFIFLQVMMQFLRSVRSIDRILSKKWLVMTQSWNYFFNLISTSVPFPGPSLRMNISPPMARTNRIVTDKPRPDDERSWRDGSALKKGSNTLDNSVFVRPTPWSWIWTPIISPRSSVRIRMVPPAYEYFRAFVRTLSKMEITWGREDLI